MTQYNTQVQANLDFIKSGKMGCTFAALFARNPSLHGWEFIEARSCDFPAFIPTDTIILSIMYPPGLNKEQIRASCLQAGFYEERTSADTIGLRFDFPDGKAWVQYFGPDADVVTRRTPYPMLTMCVKRSPLTYSKVLFKGVLHIAHASLGNVSKKVADILWNTSHENTTRQLGHKPTIKEAAKTTWHE